MDKKSKDDGEKGKGGGWRGQGNLFRNNGPGRIGRWERGHILRSVTKNTRKSREKTESSHTKKFS